MRSAFRCARSVLALFLLLACVDAMSARAEQVCGMESSPSCEPGHWCDPLPRSCLVANVTGICKPLAGGVCPDLYQPVCGCDGKTYPSDCVRRTMRVQKDHDGECKPAAAGKAK